MGEIPVGMTRKMVMETVMETDPETEMEAAADPETEMEKAVPVTAAKKAMVRIPVPVAAGMEVETAWGSRNRNRQVMPVKHQARIQIRQPVMWSIIMMEESPAEH